MDSTTGNAAWFLVVGIAVAGFLMLMFWLGRRVRDREPEPPTAESQPHLPEGGAVYEVREERDQVEIPTGGLRPHEMQGYGNFGSTTSAHPDEARKQREPEYTGLHRRWPEHKPRGGGGGTVKPA
ncbi:DUF6479 family protein [Streptomyces sp. NPDC048603]|uniref:DUF6479 family protein n=1 Tax=Streptomyces sp. NPDC048603 TaxID=3365577 RepID=UPI003717EFDD